MKKLRHYDKDLAIVLSVFGSSEPRALTQYDSLFKEIKNSVDPNAEVRLAISSRTVLKNLEVKGEKYFTLLEQIANLDRQGYKKVVVVSINVFPTEEHNDILKVVDAVGNLNNIVKYEVTLPLFAKSKQTNLYLENLNNTLRERYNASNVLYIAHGSPNLYSAGNQLFSYARDYLKLLNFKNYFYTIEGAFSYNKEFLVKEALKENDTILSEDILIVPLLLVDGNHSRNDIREIKEDLEGEFNNVILAKCPECDEYSFTLLQAKETIEYFVAQVKEAVKKINW